MISAVIITKDAAGHIHGCVQSCHDIVDEIILVDAESVDDTIEIAHAASSKVKSCLRSWEGYGAARNFGASQAATDWIMAIDADERCDGALRQHLSQTPLDAAIAYTVQRINIYKGKPMRYGMLAPELKPRIYHKGSYRWDEALVHEQLHAISDIQKRYGRIHGHLLHTTYDNISAHRRQLSHYAKLSAQQWADEGRSPSNLQAYLAGPYHFIRSYLIKGGFLDFQYGWETSITSSRYHAEKYRQFKLLKQS